MDIGHDICRPWLTLSGFRIQIKNNVTEKRSRYIFSHTLHCTKNALSCFYAKIVRKKFYAMNNEHCFLVCHWRFAHSCIQEDPGTVGTRDGQKDRWSDAFLMTQDPGNDHVMKRRKKHKASTTHAPQRKVDFCQGRRQKTLEDPDLLHYLLWSRLISVLCQATNLAGEVFTLHTKSHWQLKVGRQNCTTNLFKPIQAEFPGITCLLVEGGNRKVGLQLGP